MPDLPGTAETPLSIAELSSVALLGQSPKHPCGHHRQLRDRADGLYVADACPTCVAHCPRKSCAAWPGHQCRAPGGHRAATHGARYKAAGIGFSRA